MFWSFPYVEVKLILFLFFFFKWETLTYVNTGGFSLSSSVMGWERELYFRSGDPGLLMKTWLELIISGKVTYPPWNFTSLTSCLLSGCSKFMVLHCNGSRGLKRTAICTTFARGNREAQTLIPEFPRGPLSHFWKCAKGEVSRAGRARTVCLTLFVGAGTTYNCGATSVYQVYNKNVWGCWTEDHQARRRPGDSSWVASLEHMGVLATFMILADTYISLMMTEKDWRNDYDVCRHAGSF